MYCHHSDLKITEFWCLFFLIKKYFFSTNYYCVTLGKTLTYLNLNLLGYKMGILVSIMTLLLRELTYIIHLAPINKC